MSARQISEGSIEVDGVRTFYRSLPGDGPPSVFVHGNPTSSEQWLPFMRRSQGAALALDLPGWGRSARPARFDYSMHGLARFFGRFLDRLGVERYRLCADDWGALALIEAQRRPQRVERLAIIDGVPLLPGYRWHPVARIWRRRPLGELLNATLNRPGLALALRVARADRRPMPPEFIEMIWQALDRGTRRAILALYRSAPPAELAAAGARLERVDCPALVVWGARDRFIPSRFGRLYAERLPGAELLVVPDAGHWPWIERPELADRVVAFLEGGAARGQGSRAPGN